jgi:hypothetical protein
MRVQGTRNRVPFFNFLISQLGITELKINQERKRGYFYSCQTLGELTPYINWQHN